MITFRKPNLENLKLSNTPKSDFQDGVCEVPALEVKISFPQTPFVWGANSLMEKLHI